MFDFSGNTAFVAGASGGLGRAISQGMAEFGANIVICYNTDKEGAEAVAEEIKTNTLVQKMDWTKPDEVDSALKNSLDKFGSIDYCFNIPGMNIRKPCLELTYDEWEKIMNVNLNGMFRCAKKVGKVMVDQKKGSMINMSSIFGDIIQAKQVAYASTKGAIRQMTKVLAAEWAPYVRVNALAPGYMKTPQVREVMKDKEWKKSIEKANPFKRFGEVEEIVGPAIFLASKASSLLTGVFLRVDAGWHWYGGEIP
ncbi:hypothetical protein AKJ66_00195 [candidate division MSBL1 archaeon SCGC-AAA259E22]|uniref:2-deoxy-D-gluconate 3-dehydrogenase n=1 Tax=candidate division MSBL1 archaeon SCGC-AAA259E22 TaxID=1698265 RepID=A0A133UIE1_9EURY|nr:hypothetical protein AKJ66_00195 [candidate division MSBL1 archaeon SCGC-AAA259E22]